MQDDRSRSLRVRAFASATILIDLAGLGIILPVMPELIVQLSGSSIGEAGAIGGWLMFSYALMQFIFAPIMGYLSDTVGRRSVLLMALAGLTANYVVMALSPSLAWLFVGRLLSGALGATYPVATASVTDVTIPEERVKQFGILHAMIGLGLILGPLIGGLVAGYGVRTPFWTAAVIVALTFVVGCFAFPETLPDRANFASTKWESRKFWQIPAQTASVSTALLGVFFLVEVSFQALPAIWAFYAVDHLSWNTTMIGYSMAFYGIFIAAAQIVLPRHLERMFGAKVAGAVALGCVSCAYFGLSFIAQDALAWALIFVMALGTTIFPILHAILSRQTDGDSQGALQGILSSITAIASIVSPVVMTQIFRTAVENGQPSNSYSWPGAPFFAAAILSVVAMLIFSRSSHKAHIANPKLDGSKNNSR